jgi:hypothetical protein
MTLLINIQINLLFKRKFPIGLTSKFGNLVWPNARAALVLSVSPMFYTGFKSLNSFDGLCRKQRRFKQQSKRTVIVSKNKIKHPRSCSKCLPPFATQTFQHDVPKKAELDPESLCFEEFPERRFELAVEVLQLY